MYHVHDDVGEVAQLQMPTLGETLSELDDVWQYLSAKCLGTHPLMFLWKSTNEMRSCSIGKRSSDHARPASHFAFCSSCSVLPIVFLSR